MSGKKSKWNSSVVKIFALLIVLACLSWKPIVTFTWRLGNPTIASLANRSLTVPWPWMVTRSGEAVKLQEGAMQAIEKAAGDQLGSNISGDAQIIKVGQYNVTVTGGSSPAGAQVVANAWIPGPGQAGPP